MRDAGKVGEDTKRLTPSVEEKCNGLHPLSVLRHVAGRAVSLGKKKNLLQIQAREAYLPATGSLQVTFAHGWRSAGTLAGRT